MSAEGLRTYALCPEILLLEMIPAGTGREAGYIPAGVSRRIPRRSREDKNLYNSPVQGKMSSGENSSDYTDHYFDRRIVYCFFPIDDHDYQDPDYQDPDHKDPSLSEHTPMCLKEPLCLTLLVVSVVIFLLGFCGNALVIWISGFKMKKTVDTTWYLSLAISDFVFCAFLPFSITNMAMEEWIFGGFMCKLTSFVVFLSMFSSIFLLVVVSVDRCVSVVFPVWARNHHTIKKASIIVLLAWLLAISLSIPSLIFRDVQSHLDRTVCYDHYSFHHNSHVIVALSRLIAGFIVPFIVIIFCYSIIIILKLRTNRMTKSSKPFKVMTALVVAFFICWLPYHVFVFLELNHQNYDHTTLGLLNIGLKISTSVAAAKSFLNPLLYVFMGNNSKSSVLSKMENAMAGHTTGQYLPMSSSMDNNLEVTHSSNSAQDDKI
ncbi:Chemokine-like receptor 1 [Nibea albiflora]|uniref:Chemokine-like receptor 1 n=1 Tax=Nibea albiflora TaxID=240163 RepID=A0ACB7FCT0_NIBAL|nr:Chemokine-like receptor 1 [Nibea albiflora]